MIEQNVKLHYASILRICIRM